MIDKKKYKEIFTNELSAIRENVIWKEDTGVYYLFGVYQIVPKNNGLFEIYKHNAPVTALNRLISSVSWCVADKNNRHDITVDIKRLDDRLMRVINDVATGKSLAKKCKDSDARYILEVKIDNKIGHMYELERELKRCFKITKNWQQRGFNNEIKRSSEGGTR